MISSSMASSYCAVYFLEPLEVRESKKQGYFLIGSVMDKDGKVWKLSLHGTELKEVPKKGDTKIISGIDFSSAGYINGKCDSVGMFPIVDGTKFDTEKMKAFYEPPVIPIPHIKRSAVGKRGYIEGTIVKEYTTLPGVKKRRIDIRDEFGCEVSVDMWGEAADLKLPVMNSSVKIGPVEVAKYTPTGSSRTITTVQSVHGTSVQTVSKDSEQIELIITHNDSEKTLLTVKGLVYSYCCEIPAREFPLEATVKIQNNVVTEIRAVEKSGEKRGTKRN